MAISAPARSIEAQAMSISRFLVTSLMESPCTRTSNIDFSTASGSMPCDMVRLPCGSMSTQSTRCPSSAKAQARLSVVVVLATPPFWFANAMTLALLVTEGSAFSVGETRTASYSHVRYGFLHEPHSALGRRPLRHDGCRADRQHRDVAQRGGRQPPLGREPLRGPGRQGGQPATCRGR